MKYFALPMMMAAIAIPTIAHAEMTAEQKAEVQALVKEYILQNGDVLIQGVNNFQQKQEAQSNKEAEVKAKELLATFKDDKIWRWPEIRMVMLPSLNSLIITAGIAKAFSEIQSLIKDDKKAKIVLYDMPILGPESVEASRWSLAAKKQGKYFEYHTALMAHSGPRDEATYKKLAEDAGLDADKLAKDKAAPEIEQEIQNHIAMAQGLGISGTPGFLINEKIFRGYIPYEAMQEAIKQARTPAKAE